MSNSKLLYLRIAATTWDAIAEAAQRTGESFAKAGIRILEQGVAVEREGQAYLAAVSSTPAHQLPDTMV
jgi:hypothetical protein